MKTILLNLNETNVTPAMAGGRETRMERRIPAPGLKHAGTGFAGMTARAAHRLKSTASWNRGVPTWLGVGTVYTFPQAAGLSG